jgi:exodeoxyribonuclease III
MRIVSYNLNGIRAALKKGLIDWLAQYPVDVLCVQETKATPADVDFAPFAQLGYTGHWCSADKKGYSGVAIFSKTPPTAVVQGSGDALSDSEGRLIQADFGDITVVNAYFPSGTSGAQRQAVKYGWLDHFQTFIAQLRTERPKLVVTGDYNIAHHDIDIHDPKGNKNSSGFLPEERAWMDHWQAAGMIDTFRHLHPNRTGGYTWWSQRFPSVRLQNKGWRIDYISVSAPLAGKIIAADILPDAKHSDHCPIVLELDA